MTATRLTSQRMKILEYLKGAKTHPTAEMVYNAVKKDLPAISLATVYRNLHILADQGKILKIVINNELRFDGDTCNHVHFICNGCGKIIDIFQKEIPVYAMKKINSKDLDVECVKIIFKGQCKNCRGGGKHDRRSSM